MGFLKKLAGPIGAIGGAILGGPEGAAAGYSLGNTIGNTGSQNTSALKTWNRQFSKMTAWEKEKMQNAHQWEVQDLMAAGLNPALSAGGQGAMNATAPNPSEWNGTMQNNSITSGLKLMELANAKQKMNAEIQEIQANTAGKILDNDIVKQYGSKQAKANLANTILQAGAIKANTALAGEQALTEQTNQIYNRALTGKANAETTGTALDNAGKIRVERWHDTHPNASKFVTAYGQFRPLTQDLMAAVGLAGTAKKAGDIAKALSKTKVTERYGKNGAFKGAMKSWFE